MRVVGIHRNVPVLQSLYKGNNWYKGWVPPSTPTYTHTHAHLILKYWWPLAVALWLDKRILLPKPLIARYNQMENFFLPEYCHQARLHLRRLQIQNSLG